MNNKVVADTAVKVQAAMASGAEGITSKQGVFYKFNQYAEGTVKSLDVSDYRFIEQNTKTGTKWAKLAKEGHKVLWVIHIPTDKWFARVINGDVTFL